MNILNTICRDSRVVTSMHRGFLVLSLLLFVLAGNVHAQSVGLLSGNSDTDSAEQIPDSAESAKAMLDRLSDKEIKALIDVRTLLLEHLESDLDSQSEQTTTQTSSVAGALGFIQNWALATWVLTRDSAMVAPNLLSGQFQAFNNFYTSRGGQGTLRFVGILALAIAMGLAAEYLVRTVSKPWLERITIPDASEPTRESFQLLGLRMVLELGGLLAFLVVGLSVTGQMPNDVDEDIARKFFIAIVFIPRFLLAFNRFLLAPHRPELRLIHTDDDTANFLYKHTLGLFVLMGVGSFLIEFNRVNGLPVGQLKLGYWVTLIVHAYVVYVVWNRRHGLEQMLIGKYGDVTPMEAKIARNYPTFVIGATIIIWLAIQLIAYEGNFELLRHRPHYISLVILLFIPALDTLIRTVVAVLSPPMLGDGMIALQAHAAAKRSYLRIGRVIVLGILIFVITDLWQIKLGGAASDVVGATFASRLSQLLIILSIGYLIWEVVSLVINQKLAAEQTAAGLDPNAEDFGGEGGGAGSSRLSTILPLMRFTIQAVVIVMTVLIGLSNIGINVTPLLAGAGVVGIALGFGAQKLVQDVVSGVFFLIDDSFRAGEYISVDGTVGTIEKISLRSMQLRHHRGGIHTIPYGEIPKLTNYSRDWVLMKLKFTVPFNTDVKLIKKLFKKIGAEVLEIPHLKDDFLQPFKSQGVLEVNDVGIVVGGKFMAKPGTQFMMRKELYQRVQKEFEANGIQFARKEVRVQLDGESAEDLEPEKLSKLAGAAIEAADEQKNVP